jgi:hypothetical protein
VESSTSGGSAKTPARSENILLFPDSAFLEEVSPDGKAKMTISEFCEQCFLRHHAVSPGTRQE